MFAKIHNAKRCTVDGRDCWIAALHHDNGRFVFSSKFDTTHEAGTVEEALEWAEAELRQRGEREPRVEVER